MPRSILRLPPKQCLPKMISWLSEKYGGSKSHDQIVAIAASECNVSRKNDIGLDAGIRAALHLAHYKEKYPMLSLHENLAKAYHKVMMVDDMVLDMLENGQEQPLDAIFLELAHDFDSFDPKIDFEEEKQVYARLLHEPYEGETEFQLSTSAEHFGLHRDILEEFQEWIDEIYEDRKIEIDPFKPPDDPEILEDLEDFMYDWLDLHGYLGKYYFDSEKMLLIARDAVNAIEVEDINKIPNFAYAVFTPENEKQYAIVFFEGNSRGENINGDGTLVEPTRVLRVVDVNTNKDLDIKTGKPKKGKGWHGESERHSRARKIGKADFTIKIVHDNFDGVRSNIKTDDFEDTISVRETKNYIRKRQFEPSECEAGTYRTFTLASGKKAVGCKVNGKFKVQSILEKKKKDFTIRIAQDFEFNSKNIESLIRNLKFNVNIRNKLPENTYIFHGTSVPLGALEDDELTISKSIDQEEAIFFTIDVDEAFAYGDTVIAIPIKDLPSYTQIERNTEGNEQEQSTLMIRDDVPLPESTLIKYGKTWYGKIEFYRMEDPSAFEIEEFGGEKRDDPIEIKELVQRLNNGHGKGWFGESERHSRARKEGHADLTEDQSPLGECTSRGYTEEECFKFFNKGKQAGISSEITYSKEGLEKLDERGQENLKEMVKEVSLLPKKIRRDLKIKIYNSFEKVLPWDLEKNDTWLGFWNNKRQEIGFAADKLSNTSKRYARSSMLHEIGHKLYDLLPRYQREYVGDQYWKFKTQLEQSFDYHDRYVAKSASEYFADMFARVNESKKGTGARFYGEPYFKEMLKDYKRNREDFISDTISKILFIRKNYKEKWFFGFRTIQEADMTEDAAPKTASYRAPRAGTPAAMAGGARRTTVGQALKEQGVPLTVSGPESVTLPFKILNTETGELVEGEMVENLDKGTAQMQPVSSSNVRSVGQAQNELVVAFHSTGEGRFYRFKFSTPEMASEARNALLDSSSPGRWIWHNIRGHQAGEAVTPSKIGPAITSGKPTIGGTSASLVNYRITPVGPSRVKGYKEAYEKLQRQTSNPSTDPSTGARIEGLLGARKGFRELGRKIRQDHACDFTMEGMLTRSGEFDYRAEGQGIKIKTPENLKWIAENTDHVPVFGKRERGSHQESEYSLIGFAHQFTYIPVGEVDDYAHIYGKTELFKDIKDLSDLENPRELPVSFGFDDIGEGGVQKIIRLHHLAVSLNKIERDRCSTMNGPSCTISPISQVDMRQKLQIKPLKTVVVSLKK